MLVGGLESRLVARYFKWKVFQFELLQSFDDILEVFLKVLDVQVV